ncbi:GTP-binding protein [Treponema sp. C6A8]|uniref:CobW family GTP-binding protein n=1 Tax=Treponema sp. C6A8 TaxID=1410609 RepID=UPI000486A485|nr:GTP-binding protein [Treponema sp. C6A8]
MSDKKIPITLLCGYLGAGKTTLLNRVLTNQKGYKVAVIVNDIGEVNVDERLISKEAQITDSSSLVPLTNGCICCTLKSDMVQQIENLMKTGKFDYIMVEASGVCEPMPIAQAMEQIEIGYVDNVVGVVDASRLVDEFDSGHALEETLKKDAEESEEDIESLLIQQIEFCSTLIINKRDLVTDEQMKVVRAVINKIQPSVKVIETSHCEVPVEDVIGTNRFDFETVYASAGWVKALEEHDEEDDNDDHDEHEHGEHHDEHGHHDHDDDDEHEHGHHHHHEHRHEGESEDEYGIGSFVYYRRKPFDRVKLDQFASKWPRNIIRSKGVVWFSDEEEMAYVLETSGRQISAGYSGQWLAACPKDEQERVLAEEPQMKKDWDEKVGDRMIKMVIIGQHLDREQIEKDLDACLAK